MAAFLEFDAALSIEVNDGLVHSVVPTDEWTLLCQKWEADRARNRNPFEVKELGKFKNLSTNFPLSNPHNSNKR